MTHPGSAGSAIIGGGVAIPDSAVAYFNAQDVTGLADGDTGSTWGEQAGGNDATATGSPTYRESAINSKPAWELTSSDYWTAPIGTYSERVVIFAVVQNDNAVPDGAVIDGTTTSDRMHIFGTGSNWGIFNGSTVIEGSTDTSVQLFTGIFDSTDRLREGGAETASGDAGTDDLVDLVMGDNFQGGSSFVGDVGFYEVHDGAVAGGLQTREQEIADMWGITL
jgi:hypothetical protein